MVKITIGDYPPEYKPEVHGPFDPSRYYGKPDTPFGQVKLGELGAWFSRRNKSPVAIGRALGRAYWRWNKEYSLAKNPTGVYFLQIFFVAGAILYFGSFDQKLIHRHAKYH